jgi:hypothetical protein
MEVKLMKIKNIFFWVIISLITPAIDAGEKPHSKWLNMKNFFKHIVAPSILGSYFSSLCHELGHAALEQLFFKDVNMIAIGSGPGIYYNSPRFTAGIGLIPSGGFMGYISPEIPNKKSDILKKIAMVIAGPISGMVGLQLFFKYLKKYYFSESQYPLADFMNIFMTMHEAINLLPIKDQKTDGAIIAQLLSALVNKK